MITTTRFAEAMGTAGIDVTTGVPCSYLKALVSYAAASGEFPYYAAASEGEAIGIAAGSYLGGRFPMVLIQNSGLGNCVNPLTSLALTHDIPMIVMVSHRGEGGADAPQHILMGRITYDLLATMGVPARTLPADDAAATGVLAESAADARARMGPVAIVVPKGTFAPYEYHGTPGAPARPGRAVEVSAAVDPPAPRVDALRAMAAALQPADLVVATTGMTARELFHVADREASFYMMGSMGCAPAIGLGTALARPERKLVVIDGDGAFLMKMGTAATIGHYAPPGLLHVVLDNGTYETTGGQPTTSTTVDIAGVGAAAGYRRARELGTVEELGKLVADFRVGDGPELAVLRIAEGHLEGVGRVERTPQDIRDKFREAAVVPVHLP